MSDTKQILRSLWFLLLGAGIVSVGGLVRAQTTQGQGERTQVKERPQSSSRSKVEWSKAVPWDLDFEESPGLEVLKVRFAPPDGYERVELSERSFGWFLRDLPIRTDRTEVLTYDGNPAGSPAAAVVAMPVGDQNLQQCADSIIRLRAEYLWRKDRRDEIGFHFTSGDESRWSDWRAGQRFEIDGARVERRQGPARPQTHAEFVRYLEHLFMYAGTRSLRFDTEPVPSGESIRVGDIFVDPGAPGHAVIVLDIAVSPEGNRLGLLGQSFMPAQEFHVIRSQTAVDGVWFPLPQKAGESLDTPSWQAFNRGQVRRFHR